MEGTVTVGEVVSQEVEMTLEGAVDCRDENIVT